MTHVFHQPSGIETTRLKPKPSTSEADHLHRLIEANPNLLPGEQIAPENPIQWLVIKSEAPVSDPESGQSRWALDLLLGDQFAWPALVECKLSVNAEIRKEMIGQAIEYAANAQHYWDAGILKKYALDRFDGDSQALLTHIGRIGWSKSIDEYFDCLVRNLKDGFFRIIFAVDNAPHRLRSTVEFLNREFETIETLVVEVRRYSVGAEQLVTSGVFGYTEQIRRAKRDAAVRHDGVVHTILTFTQAVASMGIAGADQAISQLVSNAGERGWSIRFGSSGDFLLSVPAVSRKVLLAINVSERARLIWYPGSHDQDRPDVARALRAMAAEAGATAAVSYPSSPAESWVSKLGYILEALMSLERLDKSDLEQSPAISDSGY